LYAAGDVIYLDELFAFLQHAGGQDLLEPSRFRVGQELDHLTSDSILS
jgi:hypothetical protein